MQYGNVHHVRMRSFETGKKSVNGRKISGNWVLLSLFFGEREKDMGSYDAMCWRRKSEKSKSKDNSVYNSLRQIFLLLCQICFCSEASKKHIKAYYYYYAKGKNG